MKGAKIEEKGYYLLVKTDEGNFPPKIRRKVEYQERSGGFLLLPMYYQMLTAHFDKQGISYNQIKVHQEFAVKLAKISLRPYQKDAFKAWERHQFKGVIVLATGTGKTFLGLKAIERFQENTLIIVPTLALVDQWKKVILKHLRVPEDMVGVWGGGKQELKEITITTYQSASIHIPRLRKGRSLVIYDEVHHLPAETYQVAGDGVYATYKLGLSATPERADEGHVILDRIVGPQVYRRMADEIDGQFIADHETIQEYIQLTEEEQEEYVLQQNIYKNYLKKHNLSFLGKRAFQRVIMMSGRDPQALNALRAWRLSRDLVHNSENKLHRLVTLLSRHRYQKIIIFCQYTEFVEYISYQLMIPFITYETDTAERREILRKFKEGIYTKLIASTVLDEGIDVPDASIGIILSGTSQVRQQIQRLGRILRPHFDEVDQKHKNAILYEIIAQDTFEASQSQRRRKKKRSAINTKEIK